MKFIRVKGRVIPIDDKKEMQNVAKKDREIAKSGKKAAATSGALSLASGLLSARKKSFGFGAASAALGFISLTSYSAATGREMSAKDADKYAKNLGEGKEIKRGKGIGGASERNYLWAKKLSSFSKNKKKPTEFSNPLDAFKIY
jgi:hypothetical protein